MARYHDLTQGSGEWRMARRGIPTASNFNRIITPKGVPSTQARAYMHRLIAERLLGYDFDPVQGSTIWAMERGRLLEREAADDLTNRHNMKLSSAGFVTDDGGRYGCSPDRLVVGKNEAVEIKCPMPWTHIGYLLDGPGDDYIAQVQGQLLVGGWDCIHFYSYHPHMPSFLMTTTRRETYIRALRTILDDFCVALERETARARTLGVFECYKPGNGMELSMGVRAEPTIGPQMQ